MKTAFSVFAFSLVTATAANAQALFGYSIEQTRTDYTPLENATVIFDGSDPVNVSNFIRSVVLPSGLTDSGSEAAGFSLGFETEMAGETYTDFLVAPLGYIYLGNGPISYNSMMSFNFQTYGTAFTNVGFSVPAGTAYTGQSKISYVADSDKLTLQYDNFVYTDSQRGTVQLDAQLIIEKSGKVKIVLDKLSGITDGATVDFYMGIRQCSQYFSACGASGELEKMLQNRDYAKFSSADPDGTTIIFNIPQPCVMPRHQPSDLLLNPESDNIAGSFTPSDDADSYLVVYTEGDAVTGIPVDGTVYGVNDKLGDATVISVGSVTDFSIGSLRGGTEYNVTVFAMNAYGLNGPVYNTVDPLTASILTLPAPARSVEFSSSPTSVTVNVTSNARDDEVVILYTDFIERVNTGDRGYFAPLPDVINTGDVLPVAEDFTPMWTFEGAPRPSNGGTVAYVGNAGTPLTIDNLTPGTPYYFAVYTRNAEGQYTSLPVYDGTSTYIQVPYDGNSWNFPRTSVVPCGWTSSPAGPNTLTFVDQLYLNTSTGVISQGTQPIQQMAMLSRGDAQNGKEAWLTPVNVNVNERHAIATFEYCITESSSRMDTHAYNNWADGDLLQIRISQDNGETWTPIVSYDADSHPQQEETLSYVKISADLNDYRGKTLLVQLYWKTFAVPSFGGRMFVNAFTLLQGEFPAVPEVSVTGITHDVAIISWTSQQTDYQVAYNVAGSDDVSVIDVDGASSCTLTGLQVLTDYEVKVRGKLDADSYSEWSDPVYFTTADYPAIDAPRNLTVNLDTYTEDNNVTFTWDAVDEATGYEFAYRLAASTEWIYEECPTTSVTISGLTDNTAYICKVRAFCTHDRQTPYSAQLRFTVPEKLSVEASPVDLVTVTAGEGSISVNGANGACVSIHTLAGACVAGTLSASFSESYHLPAGFYIVTVNSRPFKVMIR